MTLISESYHDGAFLQSEANGFLSRKAATLKSGEDLEAGTVLGVTPTLDSVSRTADAGNTGNGVMTLATPAAADGAMAGDYRVVCVEPGSNVGTFRVENPLGVEIGTAVVAVAFDGEIKFTIADGGTDFIVGDAFTVTVVNDGEQYAQLDPAGTDGTEVAAAILFGKTDASAAAAACTVVHRLAEVKADLLVWPSGITDAQKAAALAELEALNIAAR